MPVPSGGSGLRTALEQLANSVSSPGTRCVFDYDDPVDVHNDNVSANLYRIAQEAVNNALRHARAKLVVIRLDDENGKMTLTVKDDGVGFRPERRADTRAVQITGAGLRIMAYRASVINFVLSVESSIGDGTTIKVQEC
jgi:signal transduction histidine kinase